MKNIEVSVSKEKWKRSFLKNAAVLWSRRLCLQILITTDLWIARSALPVTSTDGHHTTKQACSNTNQTQFVDIAASYTNILVCCRSGLLLRILPASESEATDIFSNSSLIRISVRIIESLEFRRNLLLCVEASRKRILLFTLNDTNFYDPMTTLFERIWHESMVKSYIQRKCILTDAWQKLLSERFQLIGWNKHSRESHCLEMYTHM